MDFALVWDAANGLADWAIEPVAGDLLSDDGLKSAVILSLFTDALAADDDVIPDGSGDRRGWWGNMPVDGSAAATDDQMGSRLWLLSRAKATPETAARAVDYCLAALNWMIVDRIAVDVTVTANWFAADKLGLHVEISRYSAINALKTEAFDLVWDAALAA